MSEREERIEVAAGVRLWTARSGSGPPLLCCSGGPGCCDYLAPVASMVDDLAHVIRFEQRGCGRSDATRPYDVETCVSDLEGLRAALGFDRWTLFGHSWGASLALAYALEHPERTRGLVYAVGNGVQNDRDWSAVYHAEKERRGEREPDFAFAHNLDVNREGNLSWRAFVKQPDLWRRIADLGVPALFIAAERDIRPGWVIEQIAAAVPGARFECIEGAEHFIWLTHADELRRLLRGFLESL